MLNLEASSKQMAMLNLEEGSTPRSAAHMAMLNLEDSSLLCRVASLEERCKEQEEEVAELKAGLANALNRIATLEGEKKHSFQVFVLILKDHTLHWIATARSPNQLRAVGSEFHEIE